MTTVRCQWCGMNTMVQPFQAQQGIHCPSCRAFINLLPPQPNHFNNNVNNSHHTNNNNYPQSPSPYYHQSPLPPPPVHWSKRAVLCGVSYRGQSNYLKGSINDVKAMTYFLTHKMGFPHQSIYVLTEDEMDPSRIPTMDNIRRAMQWLVQGCKSGDSVVFYYSGHSAQHRNYNWDEEDGLDECLCPLDYEARGVILDDEINDTIVKPLPHGAKLHALIDTCRSGTFLDLPFMWTMDWRGWQYWKDNRVPHSYKGTSGGLAVCFSACGDEQKTVDTPALTGGVSTGTMTYSFIKALEAQPTQTYGSLLGAIRNKIIETQKYIGCPTLQEPQLSSSTSFDVNSMIFTL